MTAYLLLIITVLLWASNFVVGRGIHELIPPVALAFWRWAAALLILMPFAAKPLLMQRDLICRHWKILTLLGVMAISNFSVFIYMALHFTTAINTALISSATPILIVIISGIGYGDRITPKQALGAAVSLTGLLWIISRGDVTVISQVRFSKGDLWTLAAGLNWALYSVLLRRRPRQLNPVAFLASLIMVGLAALLPVYLWELASGTVFQVSLSAAAGVIYIALFPSLLAYVCWNKAVASVGANKAGFFMHLMPVFSAIMAIGFLDERLEAFHLAGILLIFMGILLVTTTAEAPAQAR